MKNNLFKTGSNDSISNLIIVAGFVFLSGCVSNDLSPGKGTLVEGADYPPGVLLNEKNIEKFLPIGVNKNSLIQAYRIIYKQKSYVSVNGRAIAVSTSRRGKFNYKYNYFSNQYAKSAALKDCNSKYGECVLYSIGNVIVYTGPFEKDM